jgi:hypothetical protein
MTPREIRADHTLTALASCGRCMRLRTLRLGTIPARWQDTALPDIPFRCGTCGERSDGYSVDRWVGGSFRTVWRWPDLC